MNFFRAQERARRNTWLLLALFFASVAALVAGAYLALFFAYGYARPEIAGGGVFIDSRLLAYTAGGVLAVIVAGALYKTGELAGGGDAVARQMGGRLLSPQTRDAGERRLLNITEEMSIASGAPMPRVYVIPDAGVNAFAAGTSVNNAVIGVTKGALETFDRDEMQGVVAHEFSHILNGDMRMNLRLISVIHGITFLGLAGYFILRASFYSRGGGRSPLPLLGLAMIILGYGGTFFGGLIRAAVSRQREFLADAAAVQFTRNARGIGGALKKIGKRGGELEKERAAEYAHMFIAEGVAANFINLFATHPPIARRLDRIARDWRSWQTSAPPADSAPPQKPPAAAPSAAASAAAFNGAFGGGVAAAAVVNNIGRVSAAAGQASAKARASLPPDIARALADSYSARALIYTFLLDRRDAACRKSQLAHLRENADAGVYDLVVALAEKTAPLSRRACLPLVLLALPALRALSFAQYQLFADNLAAVIAADAQVELFEWCVQAIVTQSLHDCHGLRARAGATSADADYALSLLARVDGGGDARAVFAAARPAQRYVADAFEPKRLFAAMQRLANWPPKKKELFAHAAAVIVSHDGGISGDEEALLRACLMILGCPLPAVLEDATAA